MTTLLLSMWAGRVGRGVEREGKERVEELGGSVWYTDKPQILQHLHLSS